MPHEPANGVLRTTTHFDGNPKRTNLERARAYVYCIRSSLEPNLTSLCCSHKSYDTALPPRSIQTCLGGGRMRRQEAKRERERGKVSTMISRYTPVIFPFSL